jgi:hypothetical protein
MTIASILQHRAQRKVRYLAQFDGKPWTVVMTHCEGLQPMRCEFQGMPYAAESFYEAERFADWMRQQFPMCLYQPQRIARRESEA